jgi:hypothetical protein
MHALRLPVELPIPIYADNQSTKTVAEVTKFRIRSMIECWADCKAGTVTIGTRRRHDSSHAPLIFWDLQLTLVIILRVEYKHHLQRLVK